MVRKQLYGICIEGRSSHLRWRYPIRWTATDVTEWSGLYSDLRSLPSLARFLDVLTATYRSWGSPFGLPQD